MTGRIDTVERLIKATREVLIEHGFAGATLERICATAGFTRGAFYSSFGDKDALFTVVAEDEYTESIKRLKAVSDQWEEDLHPRAVARGEASVVMTQLLPHALKAIGLGRDFFILHNEFLVRAAREPAWGLQFREVNRDFVLSLSQVLTQILAAVGREPTVRGEALSQAVIGIALRATGVDAWRHELPNHDPEHPAPRGTMLDLNDISALIINLLTACSKPVGTAELPAQ
ncbi:hypothetical protein BSR28_06465 [Boudabousia liubingyangii]|uniref:TetR/AcrR family transcriptional regulator n=1 Tax=Boudabousia liubingyangii TaxID=1921764 RepID=UPI00093DC039|nr:helix-turn-helix domain-containing protein [Boudabousia liubingyangii]OKL47049.1 hypothetical protein BSR28_06465 [Boudabousia liubingyangii]